uniref:Uncharacterized protein n=1 Tax=Anopheles farauti TaxID=69004 RepID=A0A182QG69_9DIPT
MLVTQLAEVAQHKTISSKNYHSSTVLASISVNPIYHALLVSRALIVDNGALRPSEEALAALAGDHTVVHPGRLVAAHLARSPFGPRSPSTPPFESPPLAPPIPLPANPAASSALDEEEEEKGGGGGVVLSAKSSSSIASEAAAIDATADSVEQNAL